MKKKIRGDKSNLRQWYRTRHALTKSLMMRLPDGAYLIWSTRWGSDIPHVYERPLKMEVKHLNEVTGKDIYNNRPITRLREFRISEIGAINPDSITIYVENRMDWDDQSYFYRTQRNFFDTWISNAITSHTIENSNTYCEFSMIGRYNPETYKEDWKRYKTIIKSNHKTKLNKL